MASTVRAMGSRFDDLIAMPPSRSCESHDIR